MIELNKFYIGESTNFMRENIPNGFVDLTVTSPPYDDLRKYNGFVFDYKAMLDELYRVTKDGGVVIWVVGDKTDKGSETLTSFKQALYAKEIGFNVHDTMIYAKNNPVPQFKTLRYTNAFEYMFVLSKGKPNTCNYIKEPSIKFNSGVEGKYRRRKSSSVDDSCDSNSEEFTKYNKEKIKTNIWFYSVGNSGQDGIAHKHPAIFPEQLALDHILSWSNESDVVMDCMCGSGTVPKMAYLNNRNFIGIDMSEEYINDIAIPRLKQYGWNNSISNLAK